jgi:hypothetical protein
MSLPREYEQFNIGTVSRFQIAGFFQDRLPELELQADDDRLTDDHCKQAALAYGDALVESDNEEELDDAIYTFVTELAMEWGWIEAEVEEEPEDVDVSAS